MAVFCCLMIVGEAQARVTTLSGGVSLGYTDYERDYDIERPSSSSDDYSRIILSPFILIATESARDTLSFSYSPTFRFDLDDSDDNDVDNRLILDYERQLTERWEFTAANDFLQAEDANSYAPVLDPDTDSIISGTPGEDLASGESISDDQGVRRYTRNALSFGTKYAYQEGSYFAFDYNWTTLDNDEDDEASNGYQDYDKYSFIAEIAHLLTGNWFTSASLGYVIGDFEEEELPGTSLELSDDLDEYFAGVRGEYRVSAVESYSAAYKYSRADYDAPLQPDNEIQDITFGWIKEFSPKTEFNIGAGPTYTKIDGKSGDWSLNANVGLSRRIERGSLNLTAATGSEFQNFNSTEQRGTVDFQQLQADVSYMPIEYLNLRAFFTYRQEDEDDVPVIDTDSGGEGPVSGLVLRSVTTDRYAFGCGFDYRLSAHYVFDFKYVYNVYNSDLPEDEYDSYKFFVSLIYENDFFRW
ncbi:hypothetical protein [Desulfosediminicola ganghwensis]|nr:hypothetical protein [Desulfosediminicola ganghwensis]